MPHIRVELNEGFALIISFKLHYIYAIKIALLDLINQLFKRRCIVSLQKD